MLMFLKALFIGTPSCQHKWSVMNQWSVSKRRYSFDDWTQVGTRYAMRCDHCGDLKEVKMGDCG